MADAICGRSPTEIAVIARSVRPGTCPILEWNETPDAAHGERDQSRPELDCRLGEMPAEDWRLSDNLVARLNLPNMRSPAGRRVDMYAQAVRGLLDLEPDGDKREKYLEFIDIYAGLTENEFRRYRQQHPEESTMAGLIQKARDEGMRRGMRRGMERGMEQGVRQGMRQGRVEGERVVLERQIRRRFGPLAPDIGERLKRASAAELETWADNVLDAQTLDGVFD